MFVGCCLYTTLASFKFPAIVAALLLVVLDGGEFSSGWRLALLGGGELFACTGCFDGVSSLLFCSVVKILQGYLLLGSVAWGLIAVPLSRVPGAFAGVGCLGVGV